LSLYRRLQSGPIEEMAAGPFVDVSAEVAATGYACVYSRQHDAIILRSMAENRAQGVAGRCVNFKLDPGASRPVQNEEADHGLAVRALIGGGPPEAAACEFEPSARNWPTRFPIKLESVHQNRGIDSNEGLADIDQIRDDRCVVGALDQRALASED
jgi:hypothetical protein